MPCTALFASHEKWAARQLRPFRHHIYRGAVVGVRAQLSGPGAQLSGPGTQLSAILVCIPTYVISGPCACTGP